jgi:RNA polymerase sigma-70 factor, ECF subfamily
MEHDVDMVLLDKLKGDDPHAFESLFHKYYQPLYLFACKFLPKELAKDVVQDLFAEVWKSRKCIDIKTSCSAYLFKIIKNKCFKHFRDLQHHSNYKPGFLALLKEEEINFYSSSENSILEFDVSDRIEKIVSMLPSKCGLIFRESRFNGLQNMEIAEKYDISVKAVEKHITAALKIFRHELRDIIPTILVFISFCGFF